MSRRARRNHTPAFKAKGRWPPSGARARWLNWRSTSTFIPTRSCNGSRSFRKGLPGCSGLRRAPDQHADRRCEVTPCQDRRADAGERFFGSRARQSGFAERKAMIDPRARSADHEASESSAHQPWQRVLPPRPVSAADLEIMRRLDRLHLELPFAGSRMLRGLLAAEGCKIGRRHVKTLMKRMGIEALYRRPRTTKREPGYKIYPYLLRDLEIVRPNQVWAMDITYIPMARGFVYLAVVLDWFSRRVLSWRVSITMEAAFCVETLEDALARHGKPDIFNTDQGSQFTGCGLHRRARRQRHCDQHGRQRGLAGQRVRRAPVA